MTERRKKRVAQRRYSKKILRAFLLNTLIESERIAIVDECRKDKLLYQELAWVYTSLVFKLMNSKLSKLDEKKVRYIDSFMSLNSIEDHLEVNRLEQGIESWLNLEGKSTKDKLVRRKFGKYIFERIKLYVQVRRYLLGMEISIAEEEIKKSKGAFEEAERELVFDFVHGYLTQEETVAFSSYFFKRAEDAIAKIAAESKKPTFLDIDWSGFQP